MTLRAHHVIVIMGIMHIFWFARGRRGARSKLNRDDAEQTQITEVKMANAISATLG